MLACLHMNSLKFKKVIRESGLCNAAIASFILSVSILSDMLLINFDKKLFFDNYVPLNCHM